MSHTVGIGQPFFNALFYNELRDDTFFCFKQTISWSMYRNPTCLKTGQQPETEHFALYLSKTLASYSVEYTEILFKTCLNLFGIEKLLQEEDRIINPR
ncbi:hypothetical protein OUZ56_009889 [Daphnia magna]|uniref:Uncharacterized protein n=1 Tax=Daphnia magna TaxID=35525 RepID=A0ABR0AH77_9CRUS|nr:hypothetical protein OUZ56_009889 [Daphnia magna]